MTRVRHQAFDALLKRLAVSSPFNGTQWSNILPLAHMNERPPFNLSQVASKGFIPLLKFECGSVGVRN
jgi:hypothetical protein